MTYKVKINGKDYILPPRTLQVDEQIEEIGSLDGKYHAAVMSRRDVMEAIHAFVEAMAPGAFPSLEEADTNELLKASLDIIAAYDAPAQKAKVEAQMSATRELLKNPEIQKLLSVAPLLKNNK